MNQICSVNCAILVWAFHLGCGWLGFIVLDIQETQANIGRGHFSGINVST